MKSIIFTVLLVLFFVAAVGAVTTDTYWVWVASVTEATVNVFDLHSLWGIKLFAGVVGLFLPFFAAILLWFFLEDGFTGAEERATRKEADARAIRRLAEQRRNETLASMRPPQRPRL